MTTATIKWTDPTADVKGNPLPAFTVNVFQGGVDAPVGNVAAGVQAFTTGDLAPGTYQYTLETVDGAGASIQTAPVAGVVPGPALPNPPTNVTVTINA